MLEMSKGKDFDENPLAKRTELCIVTDLLPRWRNWQTRQVEGLMPDKGVLVQIQSWAFFLSPFSHTAKIICEASEPACKVITFNPIYKHIRSTIFSRFFKLFKNRLKPCFWFDNEVFTCLKRCETERNSALLNTTCIKLNTTVS